MIHFDYFSNGLVQPPTRTCLLCFFWGDRVTRKPNDAVPFLWSLPCLWSNPATKFAWLICTVYKNNSWSHQPVFITVKESPNLNMYSNAVILVVQDCILPKGMDHPTQPCEIQIQWESSPIFLVNMKNHWNHQPVNAKCPISKAIVAGFRGKLA